MSFLTPLLSVLPSIANVVGSLFGAKKNDYLKFSLRLPNTTSVDDETDNVYFKKVKDDIIACNRTKDIVQISFPAENNVPGVSYGIPECCQWPITDPISSHAKANVDQFEIIRGGNVKPSDNDKAGVGSTAIISVSGKVKKK